jgi:hypothetical protein
MEKTIYINSCTRTKIDGNWSVLITPDQVTTISAQMLKEGRQQFTYNQPSLSTNITPNRKCPTTYGGSYLMSNLNICERARGKYREVHYGLDYYGSIWLKLGNATQLLVKSSHVQLLRYTKYFNGLDPVTFHSRTDIQTYPPHVGLFYVKNAY